MVDKSKNLVTRGALERVLARAAELQGASGEEGEPDSLTEAQVEELGKEVGLSPEHIRQALAEERVRIEPLEVGGTGIAYQLFGSELIGAQRVVRGKPERILAALDRWMQKEEGLRVKRQRSDAIAWEPTRGVFGSLRRILGAGDFALTRADEIIASVVAVDEEFTLVRLQGSFRGLRSAMGNRTIVGTAFGAAASTALIVLGITVSIALTPLAWVPMAMAPAIAASAGSYYLARQAHRHTVQRAQLALEQILDRLERGDAERPSLMRIIESALPPSL